MKELANIFSGLKQAKTRTALSILQIAITLAVLASSMAAIKHFRQIVNDSIGDGNTQVITVEIEQLGTPSDGSDESMLAYYKSKYEQNKQILKSIDGVEEVSIINGFPNSSVVPDLQAATARDAERSVRITAYNGETSLVDALGMKLMAGRNFREDEIQWSKLVRVSANYPVVFQHPSILISQALADELFEGGQALNKQVYMLNEPYNVIGIVDRLPGSNPRQVQDNEFSVVFAGLPVVAKSRIVVKANIYNVDSLIAEIEQKLTSQVPLDQLVSIKLLSEIKEKTMQSMIGTLSILGFVSVFLLLVTAMGSYGQTSFTVTQRIRHIGIKRAIGATKFDILMYFLIENSVISLMGIILGVGLSYALNIVFVGGLGLLKIDITTILFCIAFIWFIGILSALVPARIAASVPPAIATRSY